jgi:replicative DNA helicase
MTASIDELAIRSQVDIERSFAAVLMINPLDTLQQCGWLESDRILDVGVKRFWELVKGQVSPDMDGDKASEIVQQAAFVAGLMPDILSKWEAVNSANPIVYARELVRREYLTKVTATTREYIQAIQAKDEKKVREMIAKLGGIETSAPSVLPSMADVANRFIDRVEAGNLALQTYIPPLDLATGGLERRALTILAARPSMGKTALALQIARNVAESGKGVILFSLEMSQEALFARMACPQVGLHWRDIMTGALKPEQKQRLREVSAELAVRYADHLVIVDGEQTTESVWRIVADRRPDLIVVDHLRLMSDKGDNENQRLGKITREGKKLAKAFDLASLYLSQLNRGVETRGKEDRRPQLSDLRESGQIEEDADAVWMMYRESYYSGVNVKNDPTEVWIRKFRNGVANARVNLMFDKASEWFEASGDVRL